MARSPIDMPALGRLPTNQVLDMLLNLLLRGPAISGHPDGAWWTNLVRLTDKSVREYEAARTELNDWVGSGSNTWSPLFRGIDHLENCVTSTHRAALFAGRLDAAGHPGFSRVATPRQQDTLRLVRNHIEHMDDKLIKSQVAVGDSVMITPLRKRLEIGTQRLQWRDLSGVITKLVGAVERASQ